MTAYSEQKLELLRNAFQHVEEGDMAGVLPYCDENIEIVQPVELPGVPRRQHGHAGVLEAFAVWPEQWDDYRIEVLRVSDVGDEVVVTMLNRGRGKTTAIPVESQSPMSSRFVTERSSFGASSCARTRPSKRWGGRSRRPSWRRSPDRARRDEAHPLAAGYCNRCPTSSRLLTW